MLELVHQGDTVEKVIELMCHRVAELFEIKDRGYIREGYKADLVLVNPDANWTVTGENILTNVDGLLLLDMSLSLT